MPVADALSGAGGVYEQFVEQFVAHARKLEVGNGLEGAGSFFQIQMQTQAAGNTGLAATFKAKGSALQERVYATPTKDVVANQWNHVAFTRQGPTGTLYLNGVAVASRNDLGVAAITRTGPSHGPGMRTTYSSPSVSGPSPSAFWKVANSDGATRSRSCLSRSIKLSGVITEPTIRVR